MMIKHKKAVAGLVAVGVVGCAAAGFAAYTNHAKVEGHFKGTDTKSMMPVVSAMQVVSATGTTCDVSIVGSGSARTGHVEWGPLSAYPGDSTVTGTCVTKITVTMPPGESDGYVVGLQKAGLPSNITATLDPASCGVRINGGGGTGDVLVTWTASGTETLWSGDSVGVMMSPVEQHPEGAPTSCTAA